jgi:thiol-disulfide isomerase/thioredoxin
LRGASPLFPSIRFRGIFGSGLENPPSMADPFLMKPNLYLVLLAATSWLFPSFVVAQEPAVTPTPPATSAVGYQAEVKAIVGQVQEKARAGKRSEADLSSELAGLDALIAKHKAEKTEEVGQVYLLKAMIYGQVINDNAKALAVTKQLKADVPETKSGQEADKIIAMLEKTIDAEKTRAALTVGAAFPKFTEKDLSGASLSPANYKGKVVMIDFWATWCGPCVNELPNVLAAYQKYHDKGFEIVGVSLDKNLDDLTGFVKSHKMEWPQYFDGKGWENKLADQYGIKAIPATFLLDGEGKIIATDLRGPALAAELEKRLGGK